MDKAKFEKRLQKTLEKIRKDWLSYLDSLPDEGNEKGKEDAYLTMTVYRNHLSYGSTLNEFSLKKENQVGKFKSGESSWLESL